MSDVDSFDYFFTATCNDSRTFGVRRVRQAVHEVYGHEGAEVQRALQSYCAIMCRERTMRYFMHWLEHSPQQPCGRVVSIWSRYEFQSQGCWGDSQKLQRIRCKMSSMFAHDAGTDRPTLLDSGLIHDENYFADSVRCSVSMIVGRPTVAARKCSRTVPPFVECSSIHHRWSTRCTTMYNKEMVGMLHTLGLTDMDHEGRPQPATHLIGGRWQYPADKHETFIPTIPMLFTVLQSCTNVQYIDRRFQVSYVCKYAAGDEEHREATVSRPKGGDTVSVHVEDH